MNAMSLTRMAGAAAMLCGTALAVDPAVADGWPTTIAGTWNVVGNLSEGILEIVQPTSSNKCKPITGTMFGTDEILGSYCPGSGRLTFFRYLRVDDIRQFYTAQLSMQGSGKPLIMGGFFAVQSNADSPGEYGFYGTKP